MSDKISIWPYLQSYLEDEYAEETGMSPYVPNSNMVPCFEYVRWVVTNNIDVIGNIDDKELQKWYDLEMITLLKAKRAPEITDMVPRVINVYFIREYKFFFNKNNKKRSTDYVLNVDRVIEEKMRTTSILFNHVQTFMLNYEIKKLLDKSITITNEKYDNIVYINSRMVSGSVMNVVGHLEKTYPNYRFNYVLLDKDGSLSELSDKCDCVQIVKSLF